MQTWIPVEQLLADIVVLRRAIRASRDLEQQAELSDVEQHLRAVLGASVPKVPAARALGISVTALDRWIDKGLVPVVRTSRSRLQVEARPLIELLEALPREARGARPIGAALRRLGRRPAGEGRYVLSAELAALPRPNVPARELRAAAEQTTPAERLRNVVELSEALSVFRRAS